MVYWLSVFFLRFITKVFFRGKSYNRENLPKSGPYIAIINHNSFMDIPALALVVKGRVATMVKHGLFEIPILKWWLRSVNMFPVVRGASDHGSFEHALQLLKNGQILYMAPEGTRKHQEGGRPKVHTGFVRLAQLAKCPIVPVAIAGTREALPPGAIFPRPKKICAKVGRPFTFPHVEVNPENHETLQKQAEQAMDRVYQLRTELYKMKVS